MHRVMSIQHGSAEFKNCDFFGLHIEHEYFITSQRELPKDK